MSYHRQKSHNLGKYKSQFEKRIANLIGEDKYERDRLPFIQPAKKRAYVPDFTIRDGVYIELKGRFTAEDRAKMVWVKEQYPNAKFYIFFQNSSVRLSKISKTTYGDWATKNGFEWSDERSGIPKHWLEEGTSHSNPRRRNKGNLNRRGC